jgi:hypothetical protein
MNRWSFRLLAVPTLLLAGCGTSVRYTPLNRAPRAMSARPPGSVRLYTSGRPVGPYVDVGLLEAQQDSGFSPDGTAEIIAALRVRAAELGCDALIIAGTSSRAGTAESVLLDVNVDRKGVYGTCAVYTVEGQAAGGEDPPARAPTSPSP